MSYFNHAYKKTFLAVTAEAAANTATSALDAGEVALIDAADYESAVIDGSGAIPAEFLIVQGNLNTTDTIGGNPLHGGYAESVKSKIVKKNYVNALWKVEGAVATHGAITVHVPDDCFVCTAHPQLRVDLKGTPVQRALNRNAYLIADATGCCTGANFTGLEIVTAWAEAINGDATINDFVTATVTDVVAAVTTTNEQVPAQLAYLTITEDYTSTDFADSSFDTRDNYNTEPLTLSVHAIDDEGDACATSCIETAGRTWTDDDTPEGLVQPLLTSSGVTAVSAAATVTGEAVLRDLILDGRYRQDGGHNQGNKDSNRFREIEGGATVVAAVTRASIYNMYYIQHSVPRFNNPTGMFDNDQYIIAIAVLDSDTATDTKVKNMLLQIGVAAGVTVTDLTA